MKLSEILQKVEPTYRVGGVGDAVVRKVWAYHWDNGVCPQCLMGKPSLIAVDGFRMVKHYRCAYCGVSGSGLGMDDVPPTLDEVLAYELSQ